MSISNADKGTIVVDEADLEYDEEFASLEVNSNVLGILILAFSSASRLFIRWKWLKNNFMIFWN